MSKPWLEMASTSTNAHEQWIRQRAQSLLTEDGERGPLLPFEQARDVVDWHERSQAAMRRRPNILSFFRPQH
jgi:hypothetical protein